MVPEKGTFWYNSRENFRSLQHQHSLKKIIVLNQNLKSWILSEYAQYEEKVPFSSILDSCLIKYHAQFEAKINLAL